MGPNDYMGAVQAIAANYAPMNTALCQGQLAPVRQFDALFSLLETTYGGNGESTFGLPNLAGAVPFGTGQQPGTTATWELGASTSQLTQLGWPGGSPAAVTAGGTPTLPVIGGVAGLALNWAITLYGIYPPRPD
jgi:microcystin-dependent protein